MNLGAGQPAIPTLSVEPLVLDEDLFLLAMSRALDKTLPSLQSKLQSMIENVFEQFQLTTPPPAVSQPVYYQQRSLEHSSTPVSDPKTQIEIVHSHLWKARSKQVALKSTAATGGVKKPHSFRLGHPRSTIQPNTRSAISGVQLHLFYLRMPFRLSQTLTLLLFAW